MSERSDPRSDRDDVEVNSGRYPDYLMPIAGQADGHRSRQEAAFRRFCDLREEVVLGYSYNTARAYWGDLDDVNLWALARDKDIVDLSAHDLRQYVALLRRRKYSESTIRRRVTVLRLFYAVVQRMEQRDDNPAQSLVIRTKRPRSGRTP